jgi:hypothetical protein
MTDEKMADPKASHEFSYSQNDVNTAPGQGTQFLDLRKSASERIRVDVKEYRGRTYIDLRVWYASEDGTYKPSSKGVTIKPEQVPEITRGLVLAGQAFDPKGGA